MATTVTRDGAGGSHNGRPTIFGLEMYLSGKAAQPSVVLSVLPSAAKVHTYSVLDDVPWRKYSLTTCSSEEPCRSRAHAQRPTNQWVERATELKTLLQVASSLRIMIMPDHISDDHHIQRCIHQTVK
jgi:hypothetical protein